MHSFEMPSRETDRAAPPRRRPGPGAAFASTTAAATLDLQRLAGNAAVSRALGRERVSGGGRHLDVPVQRVSAGDEEEGGVARSDRREPGGVVSVLRLLAEVLPEAAPLVVQGIGNAIMTAEGGKIYAAGVALNGAVGLSEIVKACYRIRSEPDHMPSYVKIAFAAMNLAGAVTYGESQVRDGDRKAIQSSAGAILQGLSYVGIIVTNRYIARKDETKTDEPQPAGATTGFSARPQQNTLRRRGREAGSDAAQDVAPSREQSTAPQLPPLELPGWRLGESSG
ncbi:hypothetical protein [Streptomyces parvulus]|uniref:hypothetical protein n=1 Tax=Streptomyces parvulus TaxID=146923 RepID=UPI0033D19107